MGYSSNNIFSDTYSHKKIGIWGFGVVGQSALSYFDQQNPTSIQILDTKHINLPTTTTPTIAIVQTQDAIKNFLEDNDYILVSPGIPLHKYHTFFHKFVHELDIFQTHNTSSTIAITGTVGKTSITYLLEQIIQTQEPKTIAAGNIGYPMLKVIQDKPAIVVIEVSSFQLQHTQFFAPDLAVLTNFYANHLDHHQSLEEYLQAKCNSIKHQNPTQKALLPLDLVDDIAKIIKPRASWSFFSFENPFENKQPNSKSMILENHKIYYCKNNIVYCAYQNTTKQIFDISTLPAITFPINWLIIFAACDLYNISLEHARNKIEQVNLPDHRLQKIYTYQGSTFYNDSKSTIWQATLQAVEKLGNKPIQLFVGGLSKGADRKPLFKALSEKNIKIYAFGKEADTISQLCSEFKIHHTSSSNLDDAFKKCIENLKPDQEILFSPGGSSFDLFENYKARGNYFEALVLNYFKSQER